MQFDFTFFWSAFLQILPAVPMTLGITLGAALLGFMGAVPLAFARFHKRRHASHLANGYISFFRGTPILLHIFLFYYGFPMLADPVAEVLGLRWRAAMLPLPLMATLGLALGAAAYFAEILRGGLNTIGPGEAEAAAAMGLTDWQAMRRILLPQAVAITQKNLGSRCINLLHGSSLAFWIAVVDITGKANLVAAHTYQFVEAFLAAALIYWLLTLAIDTLVAALDRQYQRRHKRGIA